MKAVALTTLAAAAGLATASPYLASGLTQHSVANAGGATATMTIDVSGMQFNDAEGSALNETLSITLGAGTEVTGIGWDVTLTSIGASWASEAVMGFEDQLYLTVAAGDDAPVTSVGYSSGGIIDFSDDTTLPNIVVEADANLDIEFFEGFVDNAGTGDNFFEAGSTITIAYAVPAPGSMAILALDGLTAARRRR